jgi:DNA-binding CsgD family transcriptional regulator
MKDLLQIIKKRSDPGVLIFDEEGTPIFVNSAAMAIIKDLKHIPEEICDLCKRQKEASVSDNGCGSSNCAVLTTGEGVHFAVRSIRLGGHGETQNSTHTMVLIEKIAEDRQINFKKAQEEFGLTARELEVLRFVCAGYTNPKISETLFISRNTVKDHMRNIMRNIMRKMGTGSRSQLVSLLK